MSGSEWSIVIPLVLIPVYGLALGSMAWARGRSPRIAVGTAEMWRYELAATTWVLALPGLVAAGWGIIVGMGLVLLPLGIAVGVIATRVASGKVSRNYALPLIFVGMVDLVAGAALIETFDPRYLDTEDVVWAATAALYLILTTANAVRIFTRGLKNSRLRRASAPSPEVHRDSNPTPGAFTPPVDLYRATASRIG